MAEYSISLEKGKSSLQGDVKWVSPNVIQEGMKSTAVLSEDIENVLAGEVRSFGSLSLWDPGSFTESKRAVTVKFL